MSRLLYGRWFSLWSVWLMGSVGLCMSSVQAEETTGSVQEVLKNRCFSCHGESGANEGGFNYALNAKRLVQDLIVPGKPDESPLYQRVESGEMPPEGDKLTEVELATLKTWITDGAPAFTQSTEREFIAPDDVSELMRADLDQAENRNRPFYRYFTLTHLYNAGFEDNELESHRQGLSKLVNSLSWGSEIRLPQPIDEHKTVLRIDLRHYKWQLDAWDKIVSANPYLVQFDSAAAKQTRELSKCDHPAVRGDWFVFAASRPPLYNALLELPTSPEKFVEWEKDRLGVDVARNLSEMNDVIRAGFYPSGISKSNRLIERHVSSFGAYWKSYDFMPVKINEADRRRNLKAHPTGPEGEDAFQHDGGEMIFSLPNGLQGYMLTDASHNPIEKGPTEVVVDKEAVKRGRDPEVINGVSCMNCHWSGMLTKTDQIRDHVLAQPVGTYQDDVLEFVKAVYAAPDELTTRFQEDRLRFEEAVKKCGTQLSRSEPVATLAFHFDEPLDVDLAAAETGVERERFIATVKKHPALSRELGGLSLGQPVPRDTYVHQFPVLIQQLKVGTYISPESIQDDLAANRPAGGDPQTTNPGVPENPVPMPEGNSAAPQRKRHPLIGAEAGEQRELTEHKIRFRWCPPGSFSMGRPGANDHEAPALVNHSRGFWLGEIEVTALQWHRVMKTAPWRGQPHAVDVAQQPVTYVAHGDEGRASFAVNSASEYCRRLTESERAAGRLPDGWHYVLPTEAQWEYACRAGTETNYFFGDEPSQLSQHAWWQGESQDQSAHLTGAKQPNPWGLIDMSGNVREWCADGFRARLPGGRNPFVSYVHRPGATHICRGGGWRDPADQCLSSTRFKLTTGTRSHDLGFRICLCMPSRQLPTIAALGPGQPQPNPVNPGVPHVKPDPNYVPDPNYIPVDSSYIPDEYLPGNIHSPENGGGIPELPRVDFGELVDEFEQHGVQLDDNASHQDIINALKQIDASGGEVDKDGPIGDYLQSLEANRFDPDKIQIDNQFEPDSSFDDGNPDNGNYDDGQGEMQNGDYDDGSGSSGGFDDGGGDFGDE